MNALARSFALTAALAAAALFGSHALAAETVTQAQAAQIATTASQIDINNGQLALDKSKNKLVRAFAQEMVKDHRLMNEKGAALVKKLNLTPEDSDHTRGMMRQADDKKAELQNLDGPAFDRAYIENEVALHQQVADMLQNTLIPSASDPAFKTFLQSGLVTIKNHKRHAERLLHQLGRTKNKLSAVE